MTPEELRKIAAEERQARDQVGHTMKVCMAAGCVSCHSDLVKKGLEATLKKQGLDKSCRVKGVGCLGLCAQGPLVKSDPDGVLYRQVKPNDADDLVAALGKEPVARLAGPKDLPFFSRQQRIVQGGDHAISDFATLVPEVLSFLELP